MFKKNHSFFTKSISYPINSRITIHPLSTDGAIVIYVIISITGAGWVEGLIYFFTLLGMGAGQRFLFICKGALFYIVYAMCAICKLYNECLAEHKYWCGNRLSNKILPHYTIIFEMFIRLFDCEHSSKNIFCQPMLCMSLSILILVCPVNLVPVEQYKSVDWTHTNRHFRNRCDVLGHSHYIQCLTDPDKGFSGLSEEIKIETHLPWPGRKNSSIIAHRRKKKIEQTSSKRVYWSCLLFWWQCLCLLCDL